MNGNRILYLCGGLQSSGTTLISWCFLQRRDMDGFLDAHNDVLRDIPAHWGKTLAWYKTTISCFRLVEMSAHFADAGWQVRPLLVLRDVRHVWSSLARKSYGRNGTTAEDPPLRTRLRRFKEDWERCRRDRWPVIRYERFLTEPETVLREACMRLQLPWDEAMVNWPKPAQDIADMRHGNKTFRNRRGATLDKTLIHSLENGVENILPADLNWLETEFQDFNRANGYPLHLEVPRSLAQSHVRAVPRFENTRRIKWNLRRKPLRWLLTCIGFSRLPNWGRPLRTASRRACHWAEWLRRCFGVRRSSPLWMDAFRGWQRPKSKAATYAALQKRRHHAQATPANPG